MLVALNAGGRRSWGLRVGSLPSAAGVPLLLYRVVDRLRWHSPTDNSSPQYSEMSYLLRYFIFSVLSLDSYPSPVTMYRDFRRGPGVVRCDASRVLTSDHPL